ncbi:MAG: hypothetical protein M3O41_10495 [Pseudomonadota bacterium]|nr:hypothetical protein [Pseudomonadota bacterium]
MQFAIGDVGVSSVIDFDRVELPIERFLPDADPDVLAASRDFLEPEHAMLDRGTLSLAIQTFVLRVANRTLLIDPCVEHKERPTQPDWNLRDGTGYLSRSAAARWLTGRACSSRAPPDTERSKTRCCRWSEPAKSI